MEVLVKKWGNSAAVRIPASVMETAHLVLNQAVEVRVENGRVVIEPIQKNYNLEELLAGMTDENLHTSISFGQPVGREVW